MADTANIELINPLEFTPQEVQHFDTSNDPRIQFKFRSRTTGTEEWSCPFCGHFNRVMLRPERWTDRCNGDGCRRQVGFGRVAYVLPKGPKVFPPDMIIPRTLRESFPEGDIDRWLNGYPVHRVHILGMDSA